MEKLFEDKERSNFDYANYQHNSYDFYDNSAINEFTTVRDKLNKWYSRFPDVGKKQLKGDFKKQFQSAFFELFIHELFFQQGFTLTPHPEVPNSTKNPDFLAQKGDIEIYLEAKVSLDESNEERLLKSKQNAVLDALNLINSPRYGINVREIDFLSTKQARLRKISGYFQKIIDDDADFYALNRHLDYNRHEKYITYQDQDIRVSVSLWAVDFDLDRPIISPLGGSYIGGSDEAIREAIRAKAYRYGSLDKPYIICVNSLSIKQTYTEDVYNALFGSQRNQPFEDRNQRNQIFQTSSDGLFIENSTPSYNTVSAVFITTVMPSNLHVAKHWLVEHPYTKNYFDLNRLELSYIHTKEKTIQEIAKQSIGAVLGCSDGLDEY